MDGWMNGWMDGRMDGWMMHRWVHACMILTVGRHASYMLWHENSDLSLLLPPKSFPSIPEMFPRIFDALHQVFLFMITHH